MEEKTSLSIEEYEKEYNTNLSIDAIQRIAVEKPITKEGIEGNE